MTATPPATGLAAHAKALEAAGLTLRLVSRVPLPFKPIADQAIRAAARALALFDEVRAVTWRLLQPRAD